MGGARQPEDRRRALERGLRAETFLMLKGYRLLARGYGGKGGEIDLIMR